MDRNHMLPLGIAIALFAIVTVIFGIGNRTLPLAMWVAYGVVLAMGVAVACSHWRNTSNVRMLWRAGLAGHGVAVLAFFVTEFLRQDGGTRLSNSFDALGAEFILVSLAYPLRFGGLVVGLGTALTLILLSRLRKSPQSSVAEKP